MQGSLFLVILIENNRAPPSTGRGLYFENIENNRAPPSTGRGLYSENIENNRAPPSTGSPSLSLPSSPSSSGHWSSGHWWQGQDENMDLYGLLGLMWKLSKYTYTKVSKQQIVSQKR